MKNRTIATALVSLALSLGVADQALNVQPSKVEASEFAFTQQQQEALDHLNGIRANMGLDPVELDPYLNKAAQNHADYLSVNGHPIDGSSHSQEVGKTGFTGINADERVKAVGGEGYRVSEVISPGSDVKQVIDGFFYAPYHRLPLTYLNLDKLGVGVKGDSTVMLVSGSSGYEGYQEIQYPYDGQTNVGVGFYGDENPNPLEQFNLRVSGFVISYEPPMDFYIDLDTYKVTLTDSQGNNVPLLEEKSPIGTSFFFPTELLKYNEKYTVNVSYEDEFEGKQGSSQWSFTTQKDANSLTYPTPANPFPNPNPSNPVEPPVVEPGEPTSPPVDNPTSYADFRPSAYWADNMLWAIDKGLITGFTNVRNPATGQLENQLRPSDNLTEAQFLAIMWRYIDPERLDGVQPISNYWAAPAYELSERFNLPIKGSVVNRQVADSAITRGEMARILASKHLGRVVSEREAVDFMYSMGLSDGYPDANGNVPRTYESYGVDRLLLREHIVTFMKNYDDYLGSLD